jgi:hypothetical protein
MEQEASEKEWEAIKNNPKGYKGKIIRWRCMFSCERSYDFLPYFGPLYMSVFHLNGNPFYPFVIIGSPGLNISKGDLVLITGKLDHVTRNGEIRLIPIKIEPLRNSSPRA